MSEKKEPIGILPIYKPADWTSFNVVSRMRGILHIKRIGHGGTLDPMATGVLPILVGKATKAFGIMPDSKKSYTAGFKLGITTDTQDITGRVLSESGGNVSLEDINAVLPKLTGDILQLPPMYSSCKVNGKRLYQLAREGKEAERRPRPTHIDRLEVTSFDPAAREGTLEIDCGQGTYVRTIVHDIGEKLGVGGAMTSLVRTRSGIITLDICRTIDETAELCEKSDGIPEGLLLPVDTAFTEYPECRLGERETRLYKNGVRLRSDQVSVSRSTDYYRVYGFDGEFLGIGNFYGDDFGGRNNFY